MPHDPYRALYLHIPFCRQRCLYCDFTTNAVSLDDPIVRNYVENLVLEIRRKAKEGELSAVSTVYLGGGTPSYLGQRYLTEILYTLGLSMNLTDEVEVSMEANPDSLTPELVRDLWALGVNRLSIGVQSFDDDVLGTLGRVHDADAALHAIDAAHERFTNVSVDLMCGIPGQTREGFLADVACALDAGVKHVSIYPLTIEPGTPFAKMVRKRKLPDIDGDVQADMMEAAAALLQARGMHRYEVASYAFDGFECRHNIAYWTGVPYLGLGHSAVTMTQNATHRARVRDGRVVEELDERQMRAEDLMMAMRMSCGFSDEQAAAAEPLLPRLPKTLGQLQEKGLVVHEGGRWKPSTLGWLCGNDLYGALYDLES
jgi:oxygen-independent coproporphyrinogen-3 oxidase